MKISVERVRKGLWLYKQPLVQIPSASGSTVSDLFVWRNSGEWRTFFELMDVCGLFAEPAELPPRQATFVFFDSAGALVNERRIDVVPNERRTVDLSTLTGASAGAFGTFCVFHSHPPQAVSDLGSFVTERGYVSYRYKGAPVRSYVHGNLDAVAREPDERLELLGASSLRKREYRLQHELAGPAAYEMMVVNPTPHSQSLRCRLLSTRGNVLLSTQGTKLAPSGCDLFRIEMDGQQTARVIIDSHLVMARPVVFRAHGRSANVFHG